MKKKANGPCPLCGSPMAKRKGPYGEFFGCSKYPQCKGVRKLNEVPAAPQNRQPQAPQPRPPQAAMPQPEKQRTWILATMLATGEPVVAAKGATGWDYQTENGDFGTIPNAEVAKTIKSVEERGQKVSGINPSVLFNKYYQLNPKVQEVEQQVEAPGRIPANRISPQQKDIENSFLNTPQSITINALAGSGKTTALRHLASFKQPGEKWLYLVFNKKNQVEASTGKGKFPNGVEVKTSHSFLGQVLGRSAELNIIQHTDLWNGFGERITQILDRVMEDDRTFPQSVQYVAKQSIKQIASWSKAYAVHPQKANAKEEILEIIRKYDIDTTLSTNKNNNPVDYRNQIVDKVLDLLYYCLPGNAPTPELNSMRDHDDTLWYAAINNVKWPRFDVVLADEIQDFNTCQILMLQKLSQAGARVIAVGDPNQCQPAGTLISITGGSSKPIEEVVVGDEVVTYNSKKSYFPGVNSQGRRVEKIACRDYEGDLISIKTFSKEHQCTPNHRCVVKFKADNKYALYLMTKGDLARVGIAKIKYYQSFGPAMRAISEGADNLWVLDVFDNEEAAKIAEFKTWNDFGLPGLIFKHNGQKTGSQETIDKMYASIGSNIEKAKKCLISFGRDFEYPLWSRKEQERYSTLKQNYIGSKKSFVTQACNLISGVMEVRTFDGSSKGGKWEVISVSRERKACKVYSLEVEPTEDGKRLYIANGIVTHNSIYLFRGADSQAFNKIHNVLGQAPNGNVPHELPVNYRSGRAIIKYVNEKTHVKNLQAGRDFDGQVTEGRKVEEAMGDIFNEKRQRNRLAEQTAFIARTNSPLVKTALELMKNNVEFVIIGRDFSKELVDHIEKITGKGRMAKKVPIRVLGETINNFLSERETAWKGKIARESELKDMKATTEALSNVIEYLAASGYRDPQLNMRVDDSTGFIDYIKKKFAGVNMDNAEEAESLKKKDPLSYVTLTSAHRSKGLEFDRVFILEPNLFPHPKAKTPEELLQEENAKYVAYTRAMKGLHILEPSKEEKKEKREASSKAGWYVKAKSAKKKRKK